MAQPGKTDFAGEGRKAADWIIPLSGSLCLHLLLLGMMILWYKRQPEIFVVNLLETRLLPGKAQRDQVLSPVATASPPPRPNPSPPPERPLASQHTRPGTTHPGPLPADLQTATPAASEEEVADGLIADAVTGEAVSPMPVATIGSLATKPLNGPTETAEQRYLREQFAYICDQVKARLSYPSLARRQRWAGQVRVEFTICADGSIEGLRVAASSGRALLDQRALQAVQAAAPFPAPPTPASITLPVIFTLDPLHR